MAEGQGSSGCRNALVLLLLAAAVAVVVIVTMVGGREGGPDEGDAQDPTPARRMEREPPTRTPVVPAQGGEATTLVVLPAEADAYAASAWPDESFGRDQLYLGYNLSAGFGAERVFLRFNIEENVPPGSLVNEATLRLRLQLSSPRDDEPMGALLRQLVSPWEELTLRWGDRPRWGPPQAETAIGSASRWYEWDVTALVEDWASGEEENHGLLLMGDETVQQRERIFYSRETPREDAAGQFYPQLIVEYTELDDDQAPVTEVSALPPYAPAAFVVSWTGEDLGGAGIRAYDVEYRIDDGVWTPWLEDVSFSSAYFSGGQNGRTYAFRVRAEDRVGNVEPFGAAEAQTTVDDAPPTSRVGQLPVAVNEASFNVTWTGRDAGSGIQAFDVRYRLNEGDWVPWQQQTVASEALFTTVVDGRYDFEVRAVDELGLREPFTGQAEASILVDARAPFQGP